MVAPWRQTGRTARPRSSRRGAAAPGSRRRVGSARALNVASNSMAVHPLPQFDGLLNISIARAAPRPQAQGEKCTKNTKNSPQNRQKQALDSQNSTRSFVESFSTPCGKPCVKPAPMGPKSGFSGGFSTLSTGFSTLKWNKMASTRRITRRWPLWKRRRLPRFNMERRARGAWGPRPCGKLLPAPKVKNRGKR